MSLIHKITMRENHIERKKNISKHVYGFDWYNKDGYYNKGKIHCSCPMCADKTNDRNLIKSRGPIDPMRGPCRHDTTHNRYGRKNWTISDKRKIDATNDQLEDLESMENYFDEIK